MLQAGVTMRSILEFVARLMIKSWLTSAAPSWRRLPTPTGEARASSVGSDAVRILLVGCGVAVGFGALTHDLALAGHLARKSSALTGRGADVDVLADGEMTAASCLRGLRTMQLSKYDVIVLTIGGNEAFSLMSVRRWQRDLARLLDYIQATAPERLRTLVVGVPPIRQGQGFPPAFARLTSQRGIEIDEAARQACLERRHMLHLPLAIRGGGLSSENTYEGWATLMSPYVAAALKAAGPRRDRNESVDEPARQQSLEALGILDSPPERSFQSVAVTARDLFGTAAAAVTFIDNDRMYSKASVGVSADDIPRALAFCDHTIRDAGIFVVPDATADSRFRNHPMVAGGPRLRFYAGYPIEGPGGQRVGALCVMDTEPHFFSSADASLLRSLAKEIEAALNSSLRR
jgi:hypothetical protein